VGARCVASRFSLQPIEEFRSDPASLRPSPGDDRSTPIVVLLRVQTDPGQRAVRSALTRAGRHTDGQGLFVVVDGEIDPPGLLARLATATVRLRQTRLVGGVERGRLCAVSDGQAEQSLVLRKGDQLE